MSVQKFIFLLAAVIISLPSLAQSQNRKAEEQKLMELSREWAKAAQGGTTEEITSYWSENAVLMTPDQGKLVGKEQLTAMVDASMDIPGFEIGWEPQEARVAKSGDLGYVIAHKYVKVPDEAGVVNTFYFIEVGIWEKQNDGNWKNTIDIYNPDPSISTLKH
jgi:ketosteroid isomerase-like protein